MSEYPIPEGNYVTTLSGVKTHYLEAGSGEAVLFLHGSGNGASGYSNFKTNYPVIADAGYRCIVPDMVGFGLSDKPEDVDYHLDYFVQWLKETLDELGVDKVTLVGNSLGGAVALGFALAHPDRLARLVLMAPGGLNDLPDYLQMPGMADMFALFQSEEPVTEERMKQFFIKAFVVNPDCVDDELVHERFEMMKLQNPRVMQTLVVPNMTERLAEIKTPTLGLWGLNENMMPDSGIMRLAKGMPHCRLILVPQCGHWVMIEHKDLFNRSVIDFLRNG
ncbi:MAG: alpha/beta fold hydrolase [Nevskiales bacterium]